jgi:hypothetical protein
MLHFLNTLSGYGELLSEWVLHMGKLGGRATNILEIMIYVCACNLKVWYMYVCIQSGSLVHVCMHAIWKFFAQHFFSKRLRCM